MTQSNTFPVAPYRQKRLQGRVSNRTSCPRSACTWRARCTSCRSSWNRILPRCTSLHPHNAWRWTMSDVLRSSVRCAGASSSPFPWIFRRTWPSRVRGQSCTCRPTIGKFRAGCCLRSDPPRLCCQSTWYLSTKYIYISPIYYTYDIYHNVRVSSRRGILFVLVWASDRWRPVAIVRWRS